MDSVCFFGEDMFLLSDNSLMLRVDPESLHTVAQASQQAKSHLKEVLGSFINERCLKRFDVLQCSGEKMYNFDNVNSF
jgi:hypothetical protein